MNINNHHSTHFPPSLQLLFLLFSHTNTDGAGGQAEERGQTIPGGFCVLRIGSNTRGAESLVTV